MTDMWRRQRETQTDTAREKFTTAAAANERKKEKKKEARITSQIGYAASPVHQTKFLGRFGAMFLAGLTPKLGLRN